MRKRDIDTLQLVNATLVQDATATAIVAFTNIENRDLYRLRYCIKWTDAVGSELFNIQVGITGGTPAPVTYPVLDRDGNPVPIGRLRRRELLVLKFVSPNMSGITPHFVLKNCLFTQCIITPELAPAT